MEKPLGATTWTTLLTLTGRVQGGGGCSGTSVEFHGDEPEARAALQTCATMAAALPAGQRFKILTRTATGAPLTAGTGVRVLRPIQVDCSYE